MNFLKKAILKTVIFFLFFTSCNSPQLQQLKGYALGTTYSILYFERNNKQLKTENLDSIFREVNNSMSTYVSTSDISKINKGDTSIKVDDMFFEVYSLSKKIHKTTKGSFDPTVGDLVNAWGFGPKLGLETMTPKIVDSLMQFVGFEKVKLTKNRTVKKEHPNVYLDFNAIAKGYCLDRIAAYLNNKKINNYLIELGGELVAKGKKINLQKEWTVGIDDPNQTKDRKLIATLKLVNQSMATSGNYRKFRIDSLSGKKYVHTIDAFTGYTKPSSILSVSVLAENCATADGYATAFMAMPLKETKELLKKESLDAYIIYSNNEGDLRTYATEGFKAVINKN